MYTLYDEKRDRLRDDLECILREASEFLFNKSISGYEDMRSGYAEDVYRSIKNAINEI